MTLESVWKNLESGKWNSEALRKACGANDETPTRIVSVPARWDLVDIKPSPKLLAYPPIFLCVCPPVFFRLRPIDHSRDSQAVKQCQ